MTAKRLYACLWAMVAALTVTAQAPTALPDSAALPTEEHVRLLDTPLNAGPQALLDAMTGRGVRYELTDSASRTHRLRGTLSGMDVDVEVRCNKDMTKVNLVRMSTMPGRNQFEDYDRMLRWLQKEYDRPDWRGTVRSHRFCRWFVDFDHDIVLIITGRGTVEVWFYENHVQRNIDYYSILKYCEKNPAEDVPLLTAQESVTWKRNDSTTVQRRHVVTRHKKRVVSRKRTPVRRKPAPKRRRRR